MTITLPAHAAFQIHDLELPTELQIFAAQQLLAEGSLHEFIKQAWSIVEPGVPFVDGPHIRAWCLHLEAVRRSEIMNLVGNIPPGCMKSLMTCVFWPCWVWIHEPASRWLFGSYSQNLSTRDSLQRRKIFESEWFQLNWGHKWQFTGDQNQKTLFSNDKSGWMFATSVGGGGTGLHPDYIVCLPPDSVIITDRGPRRIGDVVNDAVPTLVWSFNHESNAAEWRRVEKFERSVGRPCLKITTSTGRVLKCTLDHPVYIEGRGYVQARYVAAGETVITCEVQYWAGRLRQGVRCASHRLRQGQQLPRQSNNSLPLVPRHVSRLEAQSGYLDKETIVAVEACETPEEVYNVRIEGNHNYFADGVLVHNCDDPHNVKQSESDSVRDAACKWIDGTLGSRGVIRGVRKVLIMQRLHERDATGHLLRHHGADWVHICLPMWFEPGRMQPTPLGWIDERTVEGELLWPDAFDEKKAQTVKNSLGILQWPGQLQQRPTVAGGSMFQRSHFHYFRLVPIDVKLDKVTDVDRMLKLTMPDLRWVFVLTDEHGHERRVFPWTCYWMQMCDTATSESNDACYTVVTTVAVTPDNRVLVYEVVRERLEVPKQFGFLMTQRKRYPWLAKQGVEKASSGVGLIQTARAAGTPFHVLEAIGSKDTRAAAIATMYENDMVYHLEDAHWLDVFENELLAFPRSEFKDQVDTMAYVGLEVAAMGASQPRIRDDSPQGLKAIPTVEELMSGMHG
jgi:predicted phage terminase large subunit-like protein